MVKTRKGKSKRKIVNFLNFIISWLLVRIFSPDTVCLTHLLGAYYSGQPPALPSHHSKSNILHRVTAQPATVTRTTSLTMFKNNFQQVFSNELIYSLWSKFWKEDREKLNKESNRKSEKKICKNSMHKNIPIEMSINCIESW